MFIFTIYIVIILDWKFGQNLLKTEEWNFPLFKQFKSFKVFLSFKMFFLISKSHHVYAILIGWYFYLWEGVFIRYDNFLNLNNTYFLILPWYQH